MTKFNVLQTNQVYMTWFGIYSYKITEPTNEFFTKFIVFYCLFVDLSSMAACWLYFLKYSTTDFKTALGGLKITIALIQSGGVYLNLGLKMKSLKSMHIKLQEIVEEGGEGEGSEVYWENEQRCRKYTRMICSFVYFHISAFMVVLVPVIYHLSTGNHDTTDWNLFFYMVVPFDQDTVHGYLLMWFYQLNMATFYASSMTCVTSYFTTCCFYIDAMCNYFDYLMRAITRDIKKNLAEKDESIARANQKIFVDKLSDVVKFHIKIFDTFYMLADINSGSILALLPANCIFMSISMYDVEEYVKHFEASHLLFDISCILCALAWPAMMCYFATIATERIASLGDIVYEQNWHEYPMEIRKYVILIIARSQEPVYFTGLNLVRCTLEVLGKGELQLLHYVPNARATTLITLFA